MDCGFILQNESKHKHCLLLNLDSSQSRCIFLAHKKKLTNVSPFKLSMVEIIIVLVNVTLSVRLGLLLNVFSKIGSQSFSHQITLETISVRLNSLKSTLLGDRAVLLKVYSEFPMKWNFIFGGFVNNFGSNFHFIEFSFSRKVVKCWFPPWKHEVSSKFPFLKVLDFVKIRANFHFIAFPFHRECTVSPNGRLSLTANIQ